MKRYPGFEAFAFKWVNLHRYGEDENRLGILQKAIEGQRHSYARPIWQDNGGDVQVKSS